MITIYCEGSKVSDGFHTFEELYDHRCLLYLAWVLSKPSKTTAYQVADHFIGWDLIVCKSAMGEQVSYHVPIKYRHLYQEKIPTLKKDSHQWDGHTSEDVLDRIEQWIINET